ncbi:Dual specificity protein phosphatase 12, partial [Geodia barretti]
MLEVRPGLLLGSMGDALAVFTRVPSLVARYHVTHVLSLCNHPQNGLITSWLLRIRTRVEESDSELKDVDEEEKISKKNPLQKRQKRRRKKMVSEATRSGRGRQRGRRKKGQRQVELPKWRKFIEVADMPKSDLLHHFEECCHFIRDGRERGTVLVHCEHGVSRSVTVVLAYLMWTERRSLRILYQELKERKPEIRPNSGFMDQLRLWEDMGCRVKDDNKKYRAYRLQCKAREIEGIPSLTNCHIPIVR